MFGDAVEMLQFFHSFAHLLNFAEAFPCATPTLDSLLDALVTSDPNGPLVRIFVSLLATIATKQDEEDGDEGLHCFFSPFKPELSAEAL